LSRADVDEETVEAIREIAKLLGRAISASVRNARATTIDTRKVMDGCWEQFADAVIELAKED